jgi:hypothetical protein
MTPMYDDTLFHVVLYFPDGQYHYEARNLDAKSAVLLARNLTRRPAVHLGVIARVTVINASDDTIAFDWRHGEGIVYPKSTPPTEWVPPLQRKRRAK